MKADTGSETTLIALCSQFIDLETQYRAMFQGRDADMPSKDFLTHHGALLGRIAGIESTTLQGLQAKARVAMAYYVDAGGFGDDAPIGRLVWSLIAAASKDLYE